MNSAPQPTTLPPVEQPAFLVEWVDELDRASGWGLGRPVLKLALLAGLPGLCFVGWKALLAPTSPPESFPSLSPWALVAGFILAPMLQAVVMRFAFHWLGKIIPGVGGLNLVGAVLLGLFLANTDPQRVLGMWTYYVVGAGFLRLQSRSLNHAYHVTMLILALVNLAWLIELLR